MLYTRNTRIKITENKHSKEYSAQVEKKFLGFHWWVSFSSCSISFFDSVAGDALWEACMVEDSPDCEYEFAKLVIDKYHKLLDEKEYKPKVTYEKYPNE